MSTTASFSHFSIIDFRSISRAISKQKRFKLTENDSAAVTTTNEKRKKRKEYTLLTPTTNFAYITNNRPKLIDRVTEQKRGARLKKNTNILAR